MIILSHRGLWKSAEEHNSPLAFKRSFELGIGTETDLRWNRDHIEISHDLIDENAIRFADVLQMMGDRNLPLALNIKCDGLASHVEQMMKEARHTNYFVFDMSIPDMRGQLKAGNPVFTRLSDIETEPVLLAEAKGVWLDAFNSDWFGQAEIATLLKKGKQVCVVSPELHKRDKEKVWAMLKALPTGLSSELMLCTDLPEEAKTYFGVQK